MCVDKLSKMTHFLTIITIEETTRLFIDYVYKHHDLLLKLVSDRDTRFTNRLWVILYHMFSIKQAMFNTFRPQSND